MYEGDHCTSSCRWYAGDVTRAVGKACRRFSVSGSHSKSDEGSSCCGDIICKGRARAVSLLFTLSAEPFAPGGF